MNKQTLWCLLLSSCLVSPALAQMTQEDTATAQTELVSEPGIEEMVHKVAIVTRAKTRTAVSQNEPMAIDLGLVDVPGASAKLTEGVTAKAYARYVSYEDSLIAQLVLTGVEKNGRTEKLDSNDFVAQFNLASPELDPASPVTIEGNQEILIAALKRLSAVEDEDDNKEEKQTDDAEADTGASNAVGSNATKNADAAGYTTPAALDVAASTSPTVRVTTEGCNIRVDLAQLVAVQQSRVETTEDGAVSLSDCEDGAERYPLDRSYSVCGDAIDLETRQAIAQYLLYYADGGGNRQEVSDCLKDEDKVFDIVEKTSACAVYLDYGEMLAVPQASLIYVNASNNEVQVRSCAPSEEIASAPLVSVTDGCSIRHDFAAGRSYQTGRHIYELNGTTWQADACSDNGTEYPHETVYKNAAEQEVCAPIINREAGTVTRQSRKQIVVNGVEQFITECKPDSNNIAIQSTLDGCDNPALWEHDLAAGASYGRERFYYMLDGNAQYVTQCQNSEITYPHQVETTGWQNHDDQLYAYRLTTVYIEGTPKGRYNIKTSEVLPGEPQTSYIYEGQSPKANGEIWYEQCTRYSGRDLVNSYQRPDGSIHDLIVGEADALNQGNDCLTTIDWAEGQASFSRSAPHISGFYFRQACGSGSRSDECTTIRVRDIGCRSIRTVTATREVVRQSDGTIISSSSNTGSHYNQKVIDDNGFYGGEQNVNFCNSAGWPGYPSSIPGSVRADLQAAWGW